MSRDDAQSAVPPSTAGRTAFNPATGLLRFLNWLVRPTLPAVLGMVSTVAIFLVFAFTASDAVLYSLISGYRLSENEKAGTPYVFRRMHRFLLDEDRYRRVDLALIGGSTSRDSFWTEQALADEIERLDGGRVRILDLTAGSQLLSESWALAELAACNGADVVMLGANVNRFMPRPARDRQNPFFTVGRLGPEVSSFVESGAANPRHATLTHRIFDRPAFVLRTISPPFKAMLRTHLLDFNVSGSQETAIPEDLRHPLLRRPRKEEFRAEKIAFIERLFVRSRGKELKYPMFERIRETVERCGARFIVFIPAVNPDMIDPLLSPAYSKAYTSHNDHLRTLMGGEPLVVLNDLVDYRSDDFYDWGHLATERSIRSSTEGMARAIVPLLKKFGF